MTRQSDDAPATPAAESSAPPGAGGIPPAWRALIPVLVLLLIGAFLPRPADDATPAGGIGDALRPPTGSARPPVLPPAIDDPSSSGEAVTGRPRLRSVSTAATRPRVPEARVGRGGGPLAESTASRGSQAEAADPPAQVLRPTLRLFDADADTLGIVLADADVAFATAVHHGDLALPGGDSLTVGIVEPEGFRVLSPAVTAEAQPVWDALARGELLLSHDRAGELGIRAGVLELADGETVVVGGTASNGTPPLVDAIAARSAELELGTTRRTLLVANRRGTDIPALAARLEAATGLAPHPMPAPWPAVASLVGGDEATVAAFDSFTFHPGNGGRIAIDPAWEDAHIVRADVPILGRVRCHRLLLPQLRGALQQVVDRGLVEEIDPGDYGGCYLPRHIDWNPRAALSMHAWGIAIDVNVATNALGAEPQLDLRIVEIFEAHGFAWGGHWNRPDGMHFELARLLTVEELAGLAD